jgi:hypothetical protein
MGLNTDLFDTSDDIDEQFSEYSNRLTSWFSYFSNDQYEATEDQDKIMYFIWVKTSSYSHPVIICNNLLCNITYLYLLRIFHGFISFLHLRYTSNY